jgi:tRNA threonylcarbamoyladenosine biosynthesis protein TsaE
VTATGEALEVVTRSADETRTVGAAIAAVVMPGDVILLTGELGAGKTVLTKGLVAALGGGESTTSPTFTLCHLYPTVPPVAHVDCYRVASTDDLADLALDEALEDGCVVVEWGERIRELLGPDALECEIVAGSPTSAAPDATPDDDRRQITLWGRGATWAGRGGTLAAALERAGLAVARGDDPGRVPQ